MSRLALGIGVDVQHALKGVGKNFQDHFLVRVQAEVKNIATLNERSRSLSSPCAVVYGTVRCLFE